MEMAALITRYLKLNVENYSAVTLPYTDLTKIPEWALPYVKAMYQTGYIKGKSTKNGLVFDPAANITRAEVISILGRILPKGYTENALSFSDVSKIPEWSKPYVSLVVTSGIVTGYSDNTLRPLK